MLSGVEMKKYQKVFVYGSLKSGFGNHTFLENSDFLGTRCTKSADFLMMSFGAFPGVLKGGYGSIEGEVYLVDDTTLFKLDMLESNGIFYTRELTELENGDSAWMYILNSYSSHLTDDDDNIQIFYDEENLVFSWRRDR